MDRRVAVREDSVGRRGARAMAKRIRRNRFRRIPRWPNARPRFDLATSSQDAQTTAWRPFATLGARHLAGSQ
jgi:hypothetical protein